MRRLASALLVLVFVVGSRVTLTSQSHTEFFGIPPTPLTADNLFDDSVVQQLRLSVNPADWQTLKDHYLEDTYYPADLQWRNQVVRNVAIRSRGTGSRSGTKPGLKVDFNEYVSGQTFLGLKELVLRNNTQDASNLHERVSMLLFGRLGLPAPREAHMLLYINNEYVGLYSIVESIDKSLLSRVYGENDGYLYQFEYGDGPYYFEYRGHDPNLYVPVPFKPETHESSPKADVLEHLIWIINETDSETFREAIAPYLDLRQFLRHVAVENFVADVDGVIGDYGMNNFYLYRSGTLFSFIPWDKSEAFKPGADFSIFHNIADTPDEIRNRLMMRLLSYPDLYDQYLDTLQECVQAADGWLGQEIDREYWQIREAALADPVKPYSNGEFEQGINDLREFAGRRGDAVTRQIEAARFQK